jgi:hypothetical protein
MKLHGTLAANLEDAIASAERLRGRRIYSDTLDYWAELLSQARVTLAEASDPQPHRVARLLDRLADLLSEHGR